MDMARERTSPVFHSAPLRCAGSRPQARLQRRAMGRRGASCCCTACPASRWRPWSGPQWVRAWPVRSRRHSLALVSGSPITVRLVRLLEPPATAAPAHALTAEASDRSARCHAQHRQPGRLSSGTKQSEQQPCACGAAELPVMESAAGHRFLCVSMQLPALVAAAHTLGAARPHVYSAAPPGGGRAGTAGPPALAAALRAPFTLLSGRALAHPTRGVPGVGPEGERRGPPGEAEGQSRAGPLRGAAPDLAAELATAAAAAGAARGTAWGAEVVSLAGARSWPRPGPAAASLCDGLSWRSGRCLPWRTWLGWTGECSCRWPSPVVLPRSARLAGSRRLLALVCAVLCLRGAGAGRWAACTWGVRARGRRALQRAGGRRDARPVGRGRRAAPGAAPC